MIFGIIFGSNRIFQLITLIPIVGMLSWFVEGFTSDNSLTPNSILVLFIVSVIAFAWAFFTLILYNRSKRNAHFIAIVDALIFGGLIAGVYFLRGIASANCVDVSVNRSDDWTVNLGDVRVSGPGVSVSWRTSKRCAMLKASFALGIINVILFFVTTIVCFSHGGGFGDYDDYEYRTRSRSRHHSDRHSHRSGSRHSHHSHHSHRRVYV
ncbi:unnamed protein product [Clonostachys rosea]|uniref:MARVEL domain-containing protein n=1 Tax=Bionectria ochroleuca TaxID=29856 RepID=A0ABY6UBX0_BIOOC|nr:unnamed protein product [Clonostachys rosea]